MKKSDVRKFVTIPAYETAEEFDVTIEDGTVEFRGNSVTIIKNLTIRTCRALARIAGIKLATKVEYATVIRNDIMSGKYDSMAVWTYTTYSVDKELAYLWYLCLSLEEKGIVL
jgi:hypothetical protein